MYNLNFVAIACTLALTSCHSSPTTQDSPAQQNNSNAALVIFIATQSGGCVRTGPNCTEHILYSNGQVEAKRNNSDAIETQGAIDSGLVTSWLNLLDATDFAALKERLPQGTCAGCVDGIDFKYTIQPENNPVVLNSIDYQFNQAEPFFAITQGLYAAMRNAAPIEIRSIIN